MKKRAVIEIDEERHEVHVERREVHLSPKEFELLKMFVASDRKVLSRESLRAKLWPDFEKFGLSISTRTIDQHIARLRRKMKIPVIKTVPLYGYKFIAR